jgi:hypothetical protein
VFRHPEVDSVSHVEGGKLIDKRRMRRALIGPVGIITSVRREEDYWLSNTGLTGFPSQLQVTLKHNTVFRLLAFLRRGDIGCYSRVRLPMNAARASNVHRDI